MILDVSATAFPRRMMTTLLSSNARHQSRRRWHQRLNTRAELSSRSSCPGHARRGRHRRRSDPMTSESPPSRLPSMVSIPSSSAWLTLAPRCTNSFTTCSRSSGAFPPVVAVDERQPGGCGNHRLTIYAVIKDPPHARAAASPARGRGNAARIKAVANTILGEPFAHARAQACC